MFFEGITKYEACMKIKLSRREWVSFLLTIIFDDFGMTLKPHDRWLFTSFAYWDIGVAFNKSFIFPQLKNASENECNFFPEERTRKMNTDSLFWKL